MASVDDEPHRSSQLAPSPAGTSRRSVHAALGGGAVADVLLWRRKHVSAFLTSGATAGWFFFGLAGYSFLPIASSSLLLLVVILFFWGKSASLLNRPFPPLPNLQVSDAVLEKVASGAQRWINRVLAIVQAIAVKRDRKVFFQVILVLWLVSYIGSLLSFLTIVYIGFLFCLLVPVLYDKYQDRFDEKLAAAHSVVLQQYNIILSSNTQSTKVKKTL